MSSDREATSEQSSSVREGVSYNKVYLSGCELVEDLTWSLERELSAHYSTKEDEEYEGDWGKEKRRMRKRMMVKNEAMVLRKEIMRKVTGS